MSLIITFLYMHKTHFKHIYYSTVNFTCLPPTSVSFSSFYLAFLLLSNGS